MMSLLRPTFVALGLLVIGSAAAEAQHVPATVWTRGDVRWTRHDDRDSDSDSDRYRRNRSVRDRHPDRARNRYPTTARDVLLGRTRDRARQIDRIHADWHRRNDRYKGTREWDRRHKELLRDLDRMRRELDRARRDIRNDSRPRGGAGRASGRVN
ncbi:MAG: hypothetical protein GX539_16945 [Candidatus Cloacimonetes bacterium]|nr:hypothetical protein [Candidatus Cloacimonadota bacterium]